MDRSLDNRLTSRSTESRRRSESGFTVIELMVALVAALVAILSIYLLSSNSTRHFHEQQRIAQTQLNVRTAIEQIRRDVARAGFGGTPDSNVEASCRNAETAIHGVEFYNGQDTGELQNAGENGVSADRLRLVGNYSSSDSYLATGLNSSGNTVYLQQSWQSFRRSFGLAFSDSFAFDANAFQRVFQPNRMLHLEGTHGEHFFVRIAGVDPASAAVTFSPALPVGTSCVPGLLEGATVSPLSRIEWIVTDLLAGTSLAEGADAELLGLTSPQLVRQEIAFEAPGTAASSTVLFGNQRIVLENVADVNYDFVVDEGTPGANLADLERYDGEEVQDDIAARPGIVRSIIVSLSAHTPEQDPRFPFLARGDGPLTRFRVNPEFPGAARVRTGVAELVVSNIASRGFRYF